MLQSEGVMKSASSEVSIPAWTIVCRTVLKAPFHDLGELDERLLNPMEAHIFTVCKLQFCLKPRVDYAS